MLIFEVLKNWSKSFFQLLWRKEEKQQFDHPDFDPFVGNVVLLWGLKREFLQVKKQR